MRLISRRNRASCSRWARGFYFIYSRKVSGVDKPMHKFRNIWDSEL